MEVSKGDGWVGEGPRERGHSLVEGAAALMEVES